MLASSHFIIFFNDKHILARAASLLNNTADSTLDIRECVVQALTDLARHHSVRRALVSRKVLSKIFKAFANQMQNYGGKVTESMIEKDLNILQAYVTMMISLASVSPSKFYIPGETKEIESLRHKAILNGLLVFLQYLLKHFVAPIHKELPSNLKESFQRLHTEVLDSIDFTDYKLHFYTV
jgi:hypothetical protein